MAKITTNRAVTLLVIGMLLLSMTTVASILDRSDLRRRSELNAEAAAGAKRDADLAKAAAEEGNRRLANAGEPTVPIPSQTAPAPEPVPGQAGPPGEDGVGIISVVCAGGQWRVAYTNGDTDSAGDCTGERGPQGQPGAPGSAGPTGAPGANATGVPGANGEDGQDGAPGEPGSNGQDGSPGAPGADGSPGADGRNGTDGRDGAPGSPGAQGSPGRGIDDVECTDEGLIITYSDGTIDNAGACRASVAPAPSPSVSPEPTPTEES